MLTSIRFRTFTGSLALLLVAAGTAPAKPEPLPFKGRVKAVWDNIFLGLVAPPATFVGSGQVTHMGNTAQTGDLVLMPTPDPFVFTGFGSVTITAANGDTLTFDYEGELFAATGEGIGTFTFTGGTGRFANATGDGTFYALINLSLPVNQPMTVTLNGTISF
jgi:hypothetical protein